MRIMPFMKRKKGVQFAGIGLDTGGGGGGGGETLPYDIVIKEYTNPSNPISLTDINPDRILAIQGIAHWQTDYVPFNTYISNSFFASAYVSNTASGLKLYFTASYGGGISKAQVIFILKKEV